MLFFGFVVIAGPPNGPVLFLLAGVCRLSLSVKLPAGGRAGRRARGRSGGRHFTAGHYGYVSLGRHLVSLFMVVLLCTMY